MYALIKIIQWEKSETWWQLVLSVKWMKAYESYLIHIEGIRQERARIGVSIIIMMSKREVQIAFQNSKAILIAANFLL